MKFKGETWELFGDVISGDVGLSFAVVVPDAVQRGDAKHRPYAARRAGTHEHRTRISSADAARRRAALIGTLNRPAACCGVLCRNRMDNRRRMSLSNPVKR